MAKNCKAKANVAKTPMVKAEEKKVEAVKAVVETAKEEEKVEAVKEAVAEATTAVKETAKKAVKKATKTAAKTKKTAAVKEEPEVYLQFGENEVKAKDVLEKVKAIYVADGHRESSIKSLQIYMKPEEYKAYYVINGKITGSVDLF